MYMAADSDESSETYTETDNNEYIQTILKLLVRWQAISLFPIWLYHLLSCCLNQSYIFVHFLHRHSWLLCTEFFPSTLYQANNSMHFKRDSFKKYVVCTKYFSLYDFSQCLQIIEGKSVSKKCSNVVQPNH